MEKNLQKKSLLRKRRYKNQKKIKQVVTKLSDYRVLFSLITVVSTCQSIFFFKYPVDYMAIYFKYNLPKLNLNPIPVSWQTLNEVLLQQLKVPVQNNLVYPQINTNNLLYNNYGIKQIDLQSEFILVNTDLNFYKKQKNLYIGIYKNKNNINNTYTIGNNWIPISGKKLHNYYILLNKKYNKKNSIFKTTTLNAFGENYLNNKKSQLNTIIKDNVKQYKNWLSLDELPLKLNEKIKKKNKFVLLKIGNFKDLFSVKKIFADKPTVNWQNNINKNVKTTKFVLVKINTFKNIFVKKQRLKSVFFRNMLIKNKNLNNFDTKQESTLLLQCVQNLNMIPQNCEVPFFFETKQTKVNCFVQELQKHPILISSNNLMDLLWSHKTNINIQNPKFQTDKIGLTYTDRENILCNKIYNILIQKSRKGKQYLKKKAHKSKKHLVKSNPNILQLYYALNTNTIKFNKTPSLKQQKVFKTFDYKKLRKYIRRMEYINNAYQNLYDQPLLRKIRKKHRIFTLINFTKQENKLKLKHGKLNKKIYKLVSTPQSSIQQQYTPDKHIFANNGNVFLQPEYSKNSKKNLYGNFKKIESNFFLNLDSKFKLFTRLYKSKNTKKKKYVLKFKPFRPRVMSGYIFPDIQHGLNVQEKINKHNLFWLLIQTSKNYVQSIDYAKIYFNAPKSLDFPNQLTHQNQLRSETPILETQFSQINTIYNKIKKISNLNKLNQNEIANNFLSHSRYFVIKNIPSAFFLQKNIHYKYTIPKKINLIKKKIVLTKSKKQYTSSNVIDFSNGRFQRINLSKYLCILNELYSSDTPFTDRPKTFFGQNINMDIKRNKKYKKYIKKITNKKKIKINKNNLLSKYPVFTIKKQSEQHHQNLSRTARLHNQKILTHSFKYPLYKPGEVENIIKEKLKLEKKKQTILTRIKKIKKRKSLFLGISINVHPEMFFTKYVKNKNKIFLFNKHKKKQPGTLEQKYTIYLNKAEFKQFIKLRKAKYVKIQFKQLIKLRKAKYVKTKFKKFATGQQAKYNQKKIKNKIPIKILKRELTQKELRQNQKLKKLKKLKKIKKIVKNIALKTTKKVSIFTKKILPAFYEDMISRPLSENEKEVLRQNNDYIFAYRETRLVLKNLKKEKQQKLLEKKQQKQAKIAKKKRMQYGFPPNPPKTVIRGILNLKNQNLNFVHYLPKMMPGMLGLKNYNNQEIQNLKNYCLWWPLNDVDYNETFIYWCNNQEKSGLNKKFSVNYHYYPYVQNLLYENVPTNLALRRKNYKNKIQTLIQHKNLLGQRSKQNQYKLVQPILGNSLVSFQLILATYMLLGIIYVTVGQSVFGQVIKKLTPLYSKTKLSFLVEGYKKQSNLRIVKKIEKNFGSMAGIEDILPELSEIVSFCKNSSFLSFLLTDNTRVLKKILLTGSPGTGKTLLVQAIGGEAQIPVLIESGGSLIFAKQTKNNYKSLKYLFQYARKLAPCIIFIDEIDSFGQARKFIMQDSQFNNIIINCLYAPKHEFSQNLLNNNNIKYKFQGRSLTPPISQVTNPQANLFPHEQNELNEEKFEKQNTNKFNTIESTLLLDLLVQLDRISNHPQVFIFGATNRPQVLDPALTRPGRFNKVIHLGLPNKPKRIKIIKLYAKNLGIDPNISWEYLANLTIGLSAADLSTAINYSSINAIQNETINTLETIEYGIWCVTGYESQKNRLKNITKKDYNLNNNLQTKPTRFVNQIERLLVTNKKTRLLNRLAYYQAGKIVIHTLLKKHPPVISIHLWPPLKNANRNFVERIFEKEFSQFSQKIELESRLIGFYAGKAAEFLISKKMYSSISFAFKKYNLSNSNYTKANTNTIKLKNLISMGQSDLGKQDIMFAGWLAQLMINKWYLYGKKISIQKISNLKQTDNYKILSRDMFLIDKLKQKATKYPDILNISLDVRNLLNHPKIYRTETLIRKIRSKPSLRNKKYVWRPRYVLGYNQLEQPKFKSAEVYYHTNKKLKNLKLFYFKHHANKQLKTKPGITAINILSQVTSNLFNVAKTTQTKHFFPTTKITNIQKNKKLSQLTNLTTKTLINWNDINKISYDALYQNLILSCFNKSIWVLNQNRELIDIFASYLLQKEFLREYEIIEIIRMVKTKTVNL